MSLFTALSFTSPLILMALLGLPLVWYLLRLNPPQPQRIILPTIRFLYDTKTPPPKPLTPPLWLLILRSLIFLLLVFAFAQPIFKRNDLSIQNQTVLIIHDDYYIAGIDWQKRMSVLSGLLTDLDSAQNKILYIDGRIEDNLPDFSLMPNLASDIRMSLEKATPRPVDNDYKIFFERLENAQQHNISQIFWLTDPFNGLEKERMKNWLSSIAPTEVIIFNPVQPIELLYNARVDESRMVFEVGFLKLAQQNISEQIPVSLINSSGQIIHSGFLQNPSREDPGQQALEIGFDVPPAFLNDVIAARIGHTPHAGAVFLNQGDWVRPPVGLVTNLTLNNERPYISETYYLRRALEKYSEIKQGDIQGLIEDKSVSIIIWPDIFPLSPADISAVEEWVENGGVLIQFASEHPDVYSNNQSLMPVRLRAANRALDGTLSWDEPQRLTSWGASNSPFNGLAIPADVTIQKQVMAVPELSLLEKSWAVLEDGTPLVTAMRKEQGWTILFHITPTASWSNLPLSGLFENMFERLIKLNRQRGFNETIATAENYQLAQKITGFGQIQNLSSQMQNNINASVQFNRETKPSYETPAGLYRSSMNSFALNLGPSLLHQNVFDFTASQIELRDADFRGNISFFPYLLLLALLLIILDMIALSMLHKFSRRIAVFLLCAGLIFASINSVQAQTSDEDLIKFSITTHLAYFKTGDATFDAVTEKGLKSLGDEIMRRTSTQIGGVHGLDISQTSPALFPIIYWRLHPTEFPRITEQTRRSLLDFINHGGMILIDTASGRIENETLTKLSQLVNFPALYPIDEKHVLKRSFYLMNYFPGYYNSEEFWTSKDEQNRHDGVSGLLVGANNWALAWARNEDGEPSFAIQSGSANQREWAYRFGVNLVLYSLTGNYKGDQVHIPFILERIGK